MATTTPNYGWAVPTSTDLVKDGATAIETLGDAIDASLVDLRGGTTGQVLKKASATQMDFEWGSVGGLTLLNTTSFTNLASQSLEYFSSTYSAYRIVLSIQTVTTNQVLYYKFVNGGVDRTNSYYGSALKVNASASGSYIGHSNAAQGTIYNNLYAGSRSNYFFDVYGVNSETSTPPTISGMGLDTDLNGLLVFASQRATTETNTGIKFYPASGNISGTCSIYGYNK